MGRRQEAAELTAARDRLRELAAAQEAALGGFWQAAARTVAVRAELDEVEVDQRRHAAALVGLLGAATAADLTGWSKARLVEAQRSGRSNLADDGGDISQVGDRSDSGSTPAAGDGASGGRR